jgi:large subunit ribosomal protein L25
MIELKAQIRDKFGKKTNLLRKQGIIPAILYGAGIKNIPLQVDGKEFSRVFQEAGESSLISLEIEGKGKKVQVLIHDIARDPLTGKFLHVDFYHPSIKKEVEAEIPLVFEGEAPAVKDLGGTLVREIQTVEVKGLAQNLPREIKVDVTGLRTFEDRILIKDLEVPEGVKILRDPDEIVALVTPPEKEEEEKPIEEEKVVEEEKGKERIEESGK